LLSTSQNRKSQIIVKAGVSREKYEAKETPWEEQREMLVDFTALQLPKLHQQLMMAYGEEKGQEIYDKIYEMEFQMRSAQFIGKDVGEVMLAEMEIFPALGWKLWVEKREENGVTTGMNTWNIVLLLLHVESMVSPILVLLSAMQKLNWLKRKKLENGNA
jgi:hypothetical protein